MTEIEMLRRAVALAEANAATGQMPYGALVARAGEVIATGVNTALRDLDPTAHAEVEAVRTACRDQETLDLTGAVIYSSCEPCGICQATAAAAGISRIVYAALGSQIPDLRYPGPPAAGAVALIHVEVENATRPFERYLG
jgi:tRNA(Arg) A34 adenosine deaminase TadA